MITRSYTTFASSEAQLVFFATLRDVVAATADLEESRLVGGGMSLLLAEAFPADGTIERWTADADAAISVDIAASGTLHDRLVSAGYEATSGNRYEKGDQAVDLLVPSGTARFGMVAYGDRAFDEVPGLSLALAGTPVVHEFRVLAPDGRQLELEVRTPSVEIAVVLKALATRTRSAVEDLIDLHNLLSIASRYSRDDIGGWRLDDPAITGARLDAVRALHEVLGSPQTMRMARSIGPQPGSFAQLVQTLTLPRGHEVLARTDSAPG